MILFTQNIIPLDRRHPQLLPPNQSQRRKAENADERLRDFQTQTARPQRNSN